MKTSHPLILLIFTVVFTVSTIAAPKKKRPPVKPSGPPTVDQAAVAVLKPYDKDGDYEISRDELVAIQKDYKADPKGPLKVFDLDHNGIIDDVVDRASMSIKLGQLKMNEHPAPAPAPKKKK